MACHKGALESTAHPQCAGIVTHATSGRHLSFPWAPCSRSSQVSPAPTLPTACGPSLRSTPPAPPSAGRHAQLGSLAQLRGRVPPERAPSAAGLFLLLLTYVSQPVDHHLVHQVARQLLEERHGHRRAARLLFKRRRGCRLPRRAAAPGAPHSPARARAHAARGAAGRATHSGEVRAVVLRPLPPLLRRALVALRLPGARARAQSCTALPAPALPATTVLACYVTSSGEQYCQSAPADTIRHVVIWLDPVLYVRRRDS